MPVILLHQGIERLALEARVERLEVAILALELELAELSSPWYRRLWAWLKGFGRHG